MRSHNLVSAVSGNIPPPVEKNLHFNIPHLPFKIDLNDCNMLLFLAPCRDHSFKAYVSQCLGPIWCLLKRDAKFKLQSGFLIRLMNFLF